MNIGRNLFYSFLSMIHFILCYNKRFLFILGLSQQYDQKFFKSLELEKGIKLENIVYYQGDKERHLFGNSP